jgi:hypothetical protein
MSTMVSWFASVTQARQAVLDLLTSGIPRQDISVIISAALDEPDRASRAQSQLDAGEDHDTVGAGHPHDFVEALADAGTLMLSDSGPVLAAGPLADALVSRRGGAAGGSLGSALIAVGITEEQARMYAEQLRHGGALVAVRSDGSRDTIIYGVFRHNADPSLREQEELVGPTPARELAVDEVGGPISTSIGALTGGMIPGSWGAAGAIFEDQDEASADDDKRPRESGV